MTSSVHEESREGWAPEPGDAAELAHVIDLAFDYRGNTTVVGRDGVEREGYVFNRNADVPEPYLEMLDLDGAGPFRIPYADVRTIRFTGKDTAAGKSYAAWLARREAEKAVGGAGAPPR